MGEDSGGNRGYYHTPFLQFRDSVLHHFFFGCAQQAVLPAALGSKDDKREGSRNTIEENNIEMTRIKVVADCDIPFLKGVLEPFCDVAYLPGQKIDHAACKYADALIIRTRTKCVSALLADTRISFIATATIGTDHLDKDYLRQSGIAYANAPGCNACGVMQYVHTALFAVAARKGIDLRDKVLGVIGAGNTGERVARLWEHMGGKALRNDIDTGLKAPLVPLDVLLRESDVVSCHVPLDSSTFRMADRFFMDKLKPGAVLINACRGEIFDDDAVLEHSGKLSALILDVWNGEPGNIRRELLDASDIATPHIAGYSHEGKVNGTAMAVRAFARHFGIEPLYGFVPESEPRPAIPLPASMGTAEEQAAFASALLSVFPVFCLDKALRADPSSFERLRREYVYRHEFAVPSWIAAPFDDKFRIFGR